MWRRRSNDESAGPLKVCGGRLLIASFPAVEASE
jgi:hypothetical protein